MHLRSFALFYELYGYPNEKSMSLQQEENCNEKNMSMEREENPNENIDDMKSSKVSAKSTNKATGKTKMTKEERSRLMEEKKLLKEVCFSLYCLVFILYIIHDFDHNSL
jgi:hypothetical protein